MIIYKLTNKINNKIYIGQTTRDINVRNEEHKRHNSIIVDKAIQKYGWNNFNVEVLYETDNIDDLNEKEIYYIKLYDCIIPKGYNQCNGGNNTLGYNHKDESKQKMSKSKKLLYVGENNPFYGKKHTPEARDKMSAKRKGRVLTKEWKENIGKSMFVKVINVDTGVIFNSIKEAGKFYNIEPTHITRVCRGKRKSCGGYRWKYID